MEYFNFTSIKTFQTTPKKSKIINDKKLTKNTISTLLNEIFSTPDNKNEQAIEQFAKEYEIRRE